MAGVDKDIERLIVRALDGELDEQERRTLDGELMRNPQARRLMDEYRRVDELAASEMYAALGGSHDALCGYRLPIDPQALPSRAVPRRGGHGGRPDQPRIRRFHRGWWLLPGAIAAALLAVVVSRFPVAGPFSPLSESNGWRAADHHTGFAEPQGSRGRAAMRTVGTTPSIRRHTGREVLGIVGDNGGIYWIEVDRIRTIRRPTPGLTSENL